jgi:hypothetical protein
MHPDTPPSRFGISGQLGWLARINWGHGMIGKATVAVVALIGLLAIVAARVPSEWAMLVIGAAGIGTVFGFLFFLSNFAKKYPALAATEGITYVQTRQLDLAAKGMSLPPRSPIVADPQNPTQLEAVSNE